ncbi:ABC transporter permease [Bradyrhizobium sp. ISRA443]|uniref:ABC transporter permease n=1 Tax=unclassified Bradyrhizobium TaxID=2631580 RepID=UPI0024791077|nr:MULTISPECIES: ABC transporter permease [unclassified Bradyrhizobium]WGR93427.1 ABC transporter permease [Bradyrhizobium sp. ISRA435]WGR97970.1 ABC transporter permease [Bradyrhizobium sp. ISRA436]WGS04860.1 ABC transporter permease [Bradyrhizobium sp. ISRA437]WGS11741.1 ABC transporter permease [Bradyrhizobium sp. ISRA443]
MNLNTQFRALTIFMSPAALVAIAIVLPPVVYVFYTSFHAPALSLVAYEEVATSTLFRQALGTTIIVAGLASLLSLVLGFVVALHLARQPARRRTVLMILVLLPFWTSILVKCFAFTIILGRDGIINAVLSWIFETKVQLPLVFNRAGTLIGLTNFLIPLVVLPVLASLLAIDDAIYRAASIMGAKPARIFWTVTVPMTLPGVFAGLLSVFVMSLGAFVIPALLGGTHDQMLSNLIDFYNRQVLDWPSASAISVVLLGMTLSFAAPLAFWRRRRV